MKIAHWTDHCKLFHRNYLKDRKSLNLILIHFFLKKLIIKCFYFFVPILHSIICFQLNTKISISQPYFLDQILK